MTRCEPDAHAWVERVVWGKLEKRVCSKCGWVDRREGGLVCYQVG